MLRILCTTLFAVALAACGSSATTGAGGTTTPAATTASGTAGSDTTASGTTASETSGAGTTAMATALATKLGVNPNYVTMALSAAQSALGTGQKTPEEKAAAAQTGVDKAATQAQTDGTPLTDAQKSGLLEGLKGIL